MALGKLARPPHLIKRLEHYVFNYSKILLSVDGMKSAMTESRHQRLQNMVQLPFIFSGLSYAIYAISIARILGCPASPIERETDHGPADS